MNVTLNEYSTFMREIGAKAHGWFCSTMLCGRRPVRHFNPGAMSMGNQTMGNQTQNPRQNPGQKAPGQDDKTRRDTNPINPNDPNRQRTPGSNEDDSRTKKQMHPDK